MHLEPLRKQLEDLLKFKSDEEKKAEELRSETEIQGQKIVSQFEELQQFLSKEKQILLSRLEEEEKKILQRIREKVTQLEEQSSSLTHLISEIEEKSQQPPAVLLKDMKDTLSRCKKMKFPEPKTVSTDLECYPQQVKKVIKKFKDWYKEFGRFAVDVTLDSETAHPYLVLSEDLKSVRRGNTRRNLPDNPKRFDSSWVVLGCEGFTSGKSYWEVQVGDVSVWRLGMCKDSVGRKGNITLSPGKGYWAVGGWLGKYSALTFPATPLFLSESPRAVGILLDYEAGKVSFYNADNKSHLFTFTDTFTVKLRPFFCIFSETHLRIRPVAAWE